MPMLDSNAGRLAYFDNAPVGDNAPTVMLLHSGAASSQQWRKLIQSLTPRYRVLAPDLIGHGNTPLTQTAPTVDHELALLAALADRIAGPFHLIGHSYGGAVALELACAMPDRVASLALYEPVAFHLLRVAGESEGWAEISAIARRHVALVDKGDLAGAAMVFIDYWVGKGALLAMPEEMRHYVVGRMHKIAADWRVLLAATPGAVDYGPLCMPVLLMSGTASPLAARSTAEILRDLLPAAEWRRLEGLPHMAPVSQPERINPLFCAFLNRVSGHPEAAKPALQRGAA